MFAVILAELRIFWHVDVHCNLLLVIIVMKGRTLALPISFYYKKIARLQYVNHKQREAAWLLSAAIAASSNKSINADPQKRAFS